MLRRRRQHRALRNMGVLRQMHDHAPPADARGNAVDQRRQFVIVVHIGIEIALLLHDDFSAAGGQANRDRSRNRDRADRSRHRAVRGTGDRSPRLWSTGCPVSTTIARTAPSVRKKLASSRRAPLPCCVHRHDQHLRQPGQCRRDHAFGRHRLGETLLHDVIRQRLARADRRIALPQRLFQQGREAGAEPCRDFVARAGQRHRRWFSARRGAGRVLIASSAPSANTGSGLTASASSPSPTMQPWTMTRHRPRADRGAGDGGADGKALRGQRVAHASASSRPRRRTDGRSR